MPSLKTRLRSLLVLSKKIFLRLCVVAKHAILASVIFIGIPYIYVATDIGPRLNASIYDYFNFLLLCWIAFRLESVVKTSLPAVVEIEEIEEVEPPLLDKERENLMRLKRKLERRRKNKKNQP